MLSRVPRSVQPPCLGFGHQPTNHPPLQPLTTPYRLTALPPHQHRRQQEHRADGAGHRAAGGGQRDGAEEVGVGARRRSRRRLSRLKQTTSSDGTVVTVATAMAALPGARSGGPDLRTPQPLVRHRWPV